MGRERCNPNVWDQCYHLPSQHDTDVSGCVIPVLLKVVLMSDSWYLVDRWGRRAILLSGAVIVSRICLEGSASMLMCSLLDCPRINCHRVVDVD